MADIKTEYGTQGLSFTITLINLANHLQNSRQSTAIDNRTNKFMDALVQVKIKTGGTSANDKAVYIYAYGTVDDGTTYGDLATGTDGDIVLGDPTQLRLIGVINAPAINTSYESNPMSVAAAFGGFLPALWGIVVRNYTGAAFTNVAGDYSAKYQGVYGSVT